MPVALPYLTAKVALTSSGERADQSGALQMVAEKPGGRILLWVGLIGFVLLALWNLTEAIVGYRGSDDAWKDRLKHVAKAATYAFLAFTVGRFAAGGSSDSAAQNKELTSGLLGAPGGRVLVALAGLVVLGVGAYHVHKGLAKKFLQDLREHPGRAVTELGRAGYALKGVALGIAGVLLCLSAAQGSSRHAGGLDSAVRSIRDNPAGTVALLAIALGLLAYGVYSIARSRFARV